MTEEEEDDEGREGGRDKRKALGCGGEQQVAREGVAAH